MIKTEKEYQSAREKLEEEKERIESLKKDFKKKGYKGKELKNLMDPIISFHLQLEEEVEYYERLKNKDFDSLENFEGMGRLLIGLRIARGWSQTKLAEELGVDPSVVSKDEKNEYFGVTIQKATRILNILGSKISIKVEMEDYGEVS